MTAKRFEIVDDYLVCYDGDCFDLHKSSDIRSLVRVIGYVTDENEQLKNELNFFKESICLQGNMVCDLSDELTILKKENEQLKQRLKELED